MLCTSLVELSKIQFQEIPLNATIRQEYVKCGDPDCQNLVQLIRQPSSVLAQYNISDEAKSIIENSINDLTQ
jgi:hypothetical protein